MRVPPPHDGMSVQGCMLATVMIVHAAVHSAMDDGWCNTGCNKLRAGKLEAANMGKLGVPAPSVEFRGVRGEETGCDVVTVQLCKCSYSSAKLLDRRQAEKTVQWGNTNSRRVRARLKPPPKHVIARALLLGCRAQRDVEPRDEVVAAGHDRTPSRRKDPCCLRRAAVVGWWPAAAQEVGAARVAAALGVGDPERHFAGRVARHGDAADRGAAVVRAAP